MRYHDIVSAVPKIDDKNDLDLGGIYRTTISKQVMIKSCDHSDACHFLSNECGITDIDVNSMGPQFIQIGFENIDDQIQFLLSCPYDDLSGVKYSVEKMVAAENYREVWARFLEILNLRSYCGAVKLQGVQQMEVRTFTQAQMNEFERRFAVAAAYTRPAVRHSAADCG